MNERERAVHFYEMLTGVFNDQQSKVIRYICFAVLFAGILWAGFNYFRAYLLSDTKTPLDPDMFQDTSIMPRNDAALQRIVDLAQTVDTMRSAGTTIVTAMESIHNMPFNLDPEGGTLDPFGASGTGVSTTPSAPEQKAEITVKMIMITDNGERIAVIDVGGTEKDLVLRRGDEIPGRGIVRSIKQDRITVITDKHEIDYIDVPEIPMLKIDKSCKKSGNTSGS